MSIVLEEGCHNQVEGNLDFYEVDHDLDAYDLCIVDIHLRMNKVDLNLYKGDHDLM